MKWNRHEWYVRWFFWSLRVWDKYWKSDTALRHEHVTSLCYFIRALVLAPLTLLLDALSKITLFALLVAFPIYLWGWAGGSFIEVVGVIAFIVGVIAFFTALYFIISSFSLSVRWYYRRRLASKIKKRARPKTAFTGPNFFEVLWQYIIAKKTKICPTIVFGT